MKFPRDAPGNLLSTATSDNRAYTLGAALLEIAPLGHNGVCAGTVR